MYFSCACYDRNMNVCTLKPSFHRITAKCYDTFVCIYVFVVYLGGLNIFEGRFRYSSKYVYVGNREKKRFYLGEIERKSKVFVVRILTKSIFRIVIFMFLFSYFWICKLVFRLSSWKHWINYVTLTISSLLWVATFWSTCTFQ